VPRANVDSGRNNVSASRTKDIKIMERGKKLTAKKEGAVPDNGLNLDNQGQSCLLYPGEDGNYMLPAEKPVQYPFQDFSNLNIPSPTASADMRDLEDLIKTCGKSDAMKTNPREVNKKYADFSPMATSPRDPSTSQAKAAGQLLSNPKNWTQYNQKPNYASNIANIIKSTNAVGSPSIDNYKNVAFPAEQTTSMGFKINRGLGNFPHDVFCVEPKAKWKAP